MKNIRKILPAIALVGAGAVALAGSGNASAYNYSQRLGYYNGTYAAATNPSDVPICITVTGITTKFSATVEIELDTSSLSSSSIDLTAVTAVASSGTTYSYDSARKATATITYNETETNNPTGGSVQKCAHLNFSSAMAQNASFDAHSVPVSGITFTDNDNIEPIDSSNTNISFGYQLSLDNNSYPTESNNTYEAEYWLKSAPSYTTTFNPDYGHVELTQKVKGHAADPSKEFTIKSRVYNTNRDDSSQTYSIYITGKSPVSCHFASSSSDTTHDCTFTLKHNETAYIGCDNASSNCENDGQFIQGATHFRLEQTQDGYTTSVGATTTNVINQDLGANSVLEYTFNSTKDNSISGRFLSILPFIILATVAASGVVVLRKSSKKKAA